MTEAVELKAALLGGLASGMILQLDLTRVEAVDITTLQLLCAADAEATRVGASIVPLLSEAVHAAARNAGLALFAASADGEKSCPK